MKRILVIAILLVAAVGVIGSNSQGPKNVDGPRVVSSAEASEVLGGMGWGSCRLWACYPRSCYIWQTGHYVQTDDQFKSCGTGTSGCEYEDDKHKCVFKAYTDNTCTVRAAETPSGTKEVEYCVPGPVPVPTPTPLSN